MEQAQTSLLLRRLLARIRDVMAGGGEAQERLNRIVRVIAEDMVDDVCSVYIRRAGDVLELFATEGLRASAVHQTRLRVGEGLIGTIAAQARPISLADAQRHPRFAYRPETGEEEYHSLMGVPILRNGRVLGVVAVQNRAAREHSEEEIEILETVAMVLAEMVAPGQLVARDELAAVEGNALLPTRIEGIVFNSGIGLGAALIHQPRFRIPKLVADDVTQEHERLRTAVADMHGALDHLLESNDLGGGEHREVLETYRMIAQDVGWLRRIGEAVAGGLTAEAAVQKVHNEIRVRMDDVADPYLRERVHDLEDLADRLMQHLQAVEEPAAQPEADEDEDVVLIARSMGPAQLLDYPRQRVRGLVLEEGSSTAHVAIVAKALDIPVIGHAKDILRRVEGGDLVIVDADNGQVFVRPGEDVRHAFVENLRLHREREAAYASLRDVPACSIDGHQVSLRLNAGLLVDLQHLEETGAEGVGLYRTEIPFMVRSEFPDVTSQERFYAKVYEQVGDRPVVFRTLDIGGDKLLPYWDDLEEENPSMGWRAIRIGLDRPAMLRQQFRALIRASVGRELRVMFPMVAKIEEFTYARTLLDKELARESGHGRPVPETVLVGAMLEVPALVFQLPALLDLADFVSVGSNDLFQFLFASDRGNRRIAAQYDVLSPVVLSVLRSVVEQCRAAGVPVSLCGEMAGRPLEAMALIGAGFRDISMAPRAIGPVKTMVRSLTVGTLEKYMTSLYGVKQHTVREKLRSFAQDHGVTV